MFFGEYAHQLDAKNRIRIPAKFKQELGSKYVFVKGGPKVITIMSYDVIQSKVESFYNIPHYDCDAEDVVMEYTSGMFPAEEDGQGRVIIPEYLRKYAELEKDVITVGVGNHLNLMSKETREEKRKKLSQADVMNGLVKKAKEYGI